MMSTQDSEVRAAALLIGDRLADSDDEVMRRAAERDRRHASGNFILAELVDIYSDQHNLTAAEKMKFEERVRDSVKRRTLPVREGFFGPDIQCDSLLVCCKLPEFNKWLVSQHDEPLAIRAPAADDCGVASDDRPVFTRPAWTTEIPPELLKLPDDAEVECRRNFAGWNGMSVSKAADLVAEWRSEIERQNSGRFYLPEAAQIIADQNNLNAAELLKGMSAAVAARKLVIRSYETDLPRQDIGTGIPPYWSSYTTREDVDAWLSADQFIKYRFPANPARQGNDVPAHRAKAMKTPEANQINALNALREARNPDGSPMFDLMAIPARKGRESPAKQYIMKHSGLKLSSDAAKLALSALEHDGRIKYANPVKKTR